MTRYSRITVYWLLLLSLLLAACGGQEEAAPTAVPATETAVAAPTAAPTNTPAPTATPEPTATPAPTATAVPTATAEPAAAPADTSDFVTFEGNTAGIVVQHPADWLANDDFGLLFIASSEAAMDTSEMIDDGAVLVLLSGPTSDLGSTDPSTMLDEFMSGFDLPADAETVRGPEEISINGADGLLTIVNADVDGLDAAVLVVVVANADRYGGVIGLTPQDVAEDYLPTLEAVVRTIELVEPEVVEEDVVVQPTIIPVPAGELAMDTPVSSSLEDGAIADWTFTGSAGALFTLTVTPLDDEFDAVVDVRNADGESILGGEVDNSFDEEVVEILLPATGTYTVRVRGFADVGGTYALLLTGGSSGLPEGTTIIGYGESVTGSTADEAVFYFLGQAGDLVDLTVTPDGDLDVVVDVVDAAGASVLEDGAVDWSFDVESLRLVAIPADDLYGIVVSGFGGAAGTYELALDRTLGGGMDTAMRFDGSVAADESAAYAFTAEAGDRVRVFVQPEGEFDVVVSLLTADGAVLAEVDERFGFEELAFEVPEAGEYAFQVSGFDGAGGAYAATLLVPRTARVVLAADALVYGRFTDIDTLAYTLTGAAGQSAVIEMTPDMDTDAVLRILDAAGDELVSMDDAFSGEAETLTYVFDAAGDVTLEAADFFFGGGGFT
ncbi:MAG: hypothetical protein KC425_10915, partial [Anaerolineales bacterium]|nr:hypothetical protein [Anaerolineales bacterium]